MNHLILNNQLGSYISKRNYTAVASVDEVKQLAKQDGMKYVKRIHLDTNGKVTTFYPYAYAYQHGNYCCLVQVADEGMPLPAVD